MIDVIVDEYEDESGIDTINSINQTYYSSDDYYSSESIIDSDTKLLCHFNGDDGATDTEDSSPSGHTFTFNNNAQLDIDNYKFGGSALKLGATDTINILDSTEDWQFGTDDFTIEFWFYPTQNYGGGQVNIMANDVWWIFWYSGGFGLYMDDGHLVYAPNNALTVNEWNHVAICKYSGTMYIYVDGIDVTNSRIGTINVAGTNNIYIGNTNASYSVYGWIDELRISKGIARYTSNFTPQSSEFRGEIKNITLISDNFVADSVPSSTRIIVFEEDVDVITLNTDLKTYITRDDGTHWEEVILSAKVDYDTNKRVLIGTADLSEQDSDTNMRYKHVTANTKNLKIHGTSLLWD